MRKCQMKTSVRKTGSMISKVENGKYGISSLLDSNARPRASRERQHSLVSLLVSFRIAKPAVRVKFERVRKGIGIRVLKVYAGGNDSLTALISNVHTT